jgi:hypothetical protein
VDGAAGRMHRLTRAPVTPDARPQTQRSPEDRSPGLRDRFYVWELRLLRLVLPLRRDNEAEKEASHAPAALVEQHR